jgi:GntR family histidine utilization transcriptional repressor
VSDTATRPPAVHSRIIADFETRILSGQWHTGFRIPTEHDLAAQYGCSRPTVAKALMLLEQRGMIVRRKRAGSFVLRPPSQSIILQILDPASEIEARGLAHRYGLVSCERRAARGPERQRLGLRPGSAVLHVVGHHHAGEALYCRDERTINLAVLPDAEGVDFGATPAAHWLLERNPWRSGDILVGAMAADDTLAAAMGLMGGAALLCVERHVYTEAGTLSFGRTYYPAGQQALRAHYDTGAPPGGAAAGADGA